MHSRTGQMTNGACALHAGYLRLQTHTHICNAYCFSTATMVARTHLNVMLYLHCCLLHFNFYIISVHYLHCFELFKSNVNAKYIILIYKTRCTTHISCPHSANIPHRINNCLYCTFILIVQVKLLNLPLHFTANGKTISVTLMILVLF